MICPYCHTDHDRVIDSRSSDEGVTIRRRRQCLDCKRRYTTYERVEESLIKVVKKDGVREPYQRDKIRAGLAKACWKRPISNEQIDAVLTAVENDVYANFDSEVDSGYLGERVMEHLGRLEDWVRG